MFRTDYRRLFAIQAAFAAGSSIAWGMILPYWLDSGITIFGILVFYFIFARALFLALPLLGISADAKTQLLFGIAATAAGFFVSLLPPSPILLVVIAVFWALELGLFWASFNALFQNATAAGSRGFSSALLEAVWPMTCLVLPIVSGLIYQMFGAAAMLLSGSFILLFALIPASSLKKTVPVRVDVAALLQSAKGVKTLTILEGFWGAIIFVGYLVISLRFIEPGVELGLFLSWLGLASAASAILLGKYSDRIGDRKAVLIGSAALLAVSLAASTQTSDFFVWAVTAGLVSFFEHIFSSTLLAAYGDASSDFGAAMMSRELLQSVGALFGYGALICCLFFGAIELSFAVAALVALACPFVVLQKRMHLVVRPISTTSV